MTSTELLIEHIRLTVPALMRRAHIPRPVRPEEHELECLWRIQLCQARKLDMLARARAAGLEV